MPKRLLITSTLDSTQPFGAFTRPFYLGQYLAKEFEVYQVGLDCSAVDYAPTISVGSRSLKSYIKVLNKAIADFQPDIVYAQETLPGIAALISFTIAKRKNCSLVFDFHTFSAFEYWSRLSSVSNPVKELAQLIKTYVAQGILVFSGNPIIAAGKSTPELISQWYKKPSDRIHCIGNGVTDDLLNTNFQPEADPYQNIRPAKVVVVVAPKTYQFPTNDMSVAMTIDVAKYLESNAKDIHFVVIGRNTQDIEEKLPSNITFIGFIPKREDFVKHLKFADIGLLPFSPQAVAGGARNKALDYFATDNLVVSTPEGLRGLEEFEHLKHLLVSGYSTQEVADQLLEAALHLDKYKPLVETSHTLIQDKYSWNARANSVVNVFMQTLNQ